jgi:hypothetical protein
MLNQIFFSIRRYALTLSLILWTDLVLAQAATNVGGVALKVISNLKAVTRLITAGSYVTGAAMFFIAIFQFRQHKENPTQTPLSKPMMFLAIASALLFFPTLVTITEGTIFGKADIGGGAEGTSILK